ncbi:hypothetical protein [Burkholderia cepacia]|uniref:hypothetical protein n=1 Tax=Burkholderia cepacia TaxID=292 RepID=UPI00158B9D99|nr:hypothetical protein [Burkholderia cepacia]
MNLKSNTAALHRSLTVSVRPKPAPLGAEHVYVLNGSRLRDVLVDGRWVTVAATAVVAS